MVGVRRFGCAREEGNPTKNQKKSGARQLLCRGEGLQIFGRKRPARRENVNKEKKESERVEQAVKRSKKILSPEEKTSAQKAEEENSFGTRERTS